MRVLVCGGREYEDREKVREVLDRLHAENTITLIIEGGATGADKLAYRWARTWEGVMVKTVRADWEKHGRAAGPIRNAEMLNELPDLVVAFPGGRGTANMIMQAKRANVPVMEVKYRAE